MSSLRAARGPQPAASTGNREPTIRGPTIRGLAGSAWIVQTDKTGAEQRPALLPAGHRGGFDANIALSPQRADAVVQALVGKLGIAAARLHAAGVGPLAPVASNDAEAGRALINLSVRSSCREAQALAWLVLG